MHLSAYGAVNVLLAALWVVFIPSYWMLVHCPTCPPFLKSAGELVEMLWHPNTHRIKLKYGASGGMIYNPGSNNGVYRPACVPCPAELLRDQITPFSDPGVKGRTSGVSGQGYAVQPESLLRCVKIDGFNLTSGSMLSLAGGAAMDAKTYLHFQLFGPDHETVLKRIYPVQQPRDLRDLRILLTSNKYSSKPFYNDSLFKRGSPWPFVRGPYMEQIDDTTPVKLEGFYLLNNRPFIAPKLWDYRAYNADNGDTQYHTVGTKHLTILSNIGNTRAAASYERPWAQLHQAYARSPSISGWNEIGRGDKGHEYEWWYTNMCPKDSCEQDWWTKTSLQYWGDAQYRDYIGRFFAGGTDITCIWVPK